MNRRTFLQTTAAAAVARTLRASATRQTKHVILFTSDGVRWQDLFNGIDPKLMKEKSAGMDDSAKLRDTLWQPTVKERRQALMPFFWETLVPRGVLLSNVAVANAYRVSYPGYSEILTGRTQDSVVKSNDLIQNPTPSFLQFLKHRANLSREQVAVFASWEAFAFISENEKRDIYINCGYSDSELPNTPHAQELNQLQFDARYIETSARHDAFTFGLAMEYLDKVQPEHLYISFDETDDWAHDHRYDRVLESLQYVDRSLEQLWRYVQSSPKYKDSTTLVVSTDHGRGSELKDWSDHGPRVPGDDQIWAFFIGPDTPATGEASKTRLYHQQDIAPTILELLGIPYQEYAGVAGTPIAEAIAARSNS